MRVSHVPEPLLDFGYQQRLAYPRDGLFLYGPVDGGRPAIRYGVIGTAQGVARFFQWVSSIDIAQAPPPSKKNSDIYDPHHVPFPGFGAAFRSSWPTTPVKTIDAVSASDLSKALHLANRNEAIKSAVDLYVQPLIAAAHRAEDLPNFWFVVIPEEVFELGRPKSTIPVRERVPGKVAISKEKARELQTEPS